MQGWDLFFKSWGNQVRIGDLLSYAYRCTQLMTNPWLRLDAIFGQFNHNRIRCRTLIVVLRAKDLYMRWWWRRERERERLRRCFPHRSASPPFIVYSAGENDRLLEMQCMSMRGAASMQMSECNAISRLSVPSLLISCDITSFVRYTAAASYALPKIFNSYEDAAAPHANAIDFSPFLSHVRAIIFAGISFHSHWHIIRSRFGCRCVAGRLAHVQWMWNAWKCCCVLFPRLDILRTMHAHRTLPSNCKNKQFMCYGGCRMLFSPSKKKKKNNTLLYSSMSSSRCIQWRRPNWQIE